MNRPGILVVSVRGISRILASLRVSDQDEMPHLWQVFFFGWGGGGGGGVYTRKDNSYNKLSFRLLGSIFASLSCPV